MMLGRFNSSRGAAFVLNSALECLNNEKTPMYTSVRCHTKHYNPKYKKERAAKFIYVKLPDFQKINRSPEELSREEIRSMMKERGVQPQRPWTDRPVYISSTGSVFEPYVPPEGDGKVSMITKQGAKQKLEFVQKKSKSMMAVRKIRKFEEEFDFPEFLTEAQDIYVKAHEAMINKDRDKLISFVTERAYPEIAHNIGDKTLRWSFVESTEPSRVVHVRCTEVITEDNIFAQITVRFHNRQMLAVYDRFGRLMHGSETLPKDVLEYVVFEKHMSNKYGRWRIHAKIIPTWMPQPEPPRKTYLAPRDEKTELVATQPVQDSAEVASADVDKNRPLEPALA